MYAVNDPSLEKRGTGGECLVEKMVQASILFIGEKVATVRE
jgi:hypothetical protein